MTIEQLYDQAIKPLPAADRLRLATLILNEIPSSPSEPLAERKPPPRVNRAPVEIAEAIVALPIEAKDHTWGGRDHDRVLYGDKDAR